MTDTLPDDDRTERRPKGEPWRFADRVRLGEGIFGQNYLPDYLDWWQPFKEFKMKEPEQRAIEFVERTIDEVKKLFQENDFDCDFRPGGFEDSQQVWVVRLYDQTAKFVAKPFDPVAMIRIIHPPQPRFELHTASKEEPGAVVKQHVEAHALFKALAGRLKNSYNEKEKNWPTLPLEPVRRPPENTGTL